MLKYRLISASILLSFLGIAVFGYRWIGASVIFGLMALVMACIGLKEYFSMTQKLGLPGYPRVTMVAGCLFLGAIAVDGIMARCQDDQVHMWLTPTELLIAYGFFMVSVIATMRSKDLVQGIKSFIASLAGFVYLCWTLSFLMKIYFYGNANSADIGLGPYLMFFVVMVTKCGDIGGYTFGKTCHKIYGKTHKLVPSLSPGKSWEGFVGCIIFSALTAVLLVAIKGGTIESSGLSQSVPLIGSVKIVESHVIMTYPWAVVFGVVLSVLGLVGDLIESCFKRAAGVKDSGTILPGMGGMLDALDSLVVTAPLFYIYLLIV